MLTRRRLLAHAAMAVAARALTAVAAPGYELKAGQAGMGKYNHFLTVQELIDLVAFLRQLPDLEQSDRRDNLSLPSIEHLGKTDHGTYTVAEGEDPPEKQLEAGRIVFTLHGRKLRGGFALARFKAGRHGDEWLLIKRKDEKAESGWRLRTELTPKKLGTLSVKIPPCESA